MDSVSLTSPTPPARGNRSFEEGLEGHDGEVVLVCRRNRVAGSSLSSLSPPVCGLAGGGLKERDGELVLGR